MWVHPRIEGTQADSVTTRVVSDRVLWNTQGVSGVKALLKDSNSYYQGRMVASATTDSSGQYTGAYAFTTTSLAHPRKPSARISRSRQSP